MRKRLGRLVAVLGKFADFLEGKHLRGVGNRKRNVSHWIGSRQYISIQRRGLRDEAAAGRLWPVQSGLPSGCYSHSLFYECGKWGRLLS